MNILITDGENRSSLAVTRSLGKQGNSIIVCSPQKNNISAASRYTSSYYRVIDPILDEKRFVCDIVDIIKKEDVDYIFPMTEPSVLALTKYRDLIPVDHIIAAPSFAIASKAFDKFHVFNLARRLGVGIPKTIFIKNYSDLKQQIKQISEFPVVVKPGMSSIPYKNGFIKTGVMYAHDINELNLIYQNQKGLKEHPSTIQERIEGPGTGLFTLFDRARHLALFSHERIKEKPPSGGVSVVCQSVSLDIEMVEDSRKLLTAIGWKGVAMVEFKRDVRDGRAKLMEINGRFWGSLQLAISAGVDFPTLYLHYLHDNQIPYSVPNYHIGLKLKWLLGTLDYLILKLKAKKSPDVVSNTFTERLFEVKKFLKFRQKDTVFDVLQKDDLMPFLVEVKEYVKHIVGI